MQKLTTIIPLKLLEPFCGQTIRLHVCTATSGCSLPCFPPIACSGHTTGGQPGTSSPTPMRNASTLQHDSEELLQRNREQSQRNRMQNQSQTRFHAPATSRSRQDTSHPLDRQQNRSDPRVVQPANSKPRDEYQDGSAPQDGNAKRQVGSDGERGVRCHQDREAERGEKRRRVWGPGEEVPVFMSGETADLDTARLMVRDLLVGALPYPVPLSCIGAMLEPMLPPNTPLPIQQVCFLVLFH